MNYFTNGNFLVKRPWAGVTWR